MSGEIVLVADPSEFYRERYVRALEVIGRAGAAAATLREANRLIECPGVGAAILELQFPDGSGFGLLRALRQRSPETALIVGASTPSVAAAVQAMRLGATDVLTKPISDDQIACAFDRSMPGFRGDPMPGWARLPAMSIDRVIWEHIHRVLMESNWNISEAARRLGIYRQALQKRIRKVPSLRDPLRS